MNPKLRAYLDLIRVPNLITAAADVLAGYLYVSADTGGWGAAMRLAGASVCLYAGGVTLNDVCDVDRDAIERPERPIPSGMVSRPVAMWLSVGLLVAGGALAWSVAVRSGVLASVLVAAIVLYNAVLKRSAAAPAMMGLCRALNLAMGMSLAVTLWSGRVLVPLALMWLYAASLTHFARGEAGAARRGQLLIGTIGICLAAAGLVTLASNTDGPRLAYWAAVAILAAVLAWRGWTAVSSPTRETVMGSVRFFVLSLILFDACIVWSARGMTWAIVIVVLLIPSLALSRVFRVT